MVRLTGPVGDYKVTFAAAGKSVELVNPGTPNLRVEITAPDVDLRGESFVMDAGADARCGGAKSEHRRRASARHSRSPRRCAR